MSFLEELTKTPVIDAALVRRSRRPKPFHVMLHFDHARRMYVCRCGATMRWKTDRRRKLRGYFACPEAKKLYDRAYWQRTGSYRRYKRRMNTRIDDKHRKIELYTKLSPQGLASLGNLFKGVTA